MKKSKVKLYKIEKAIKVPPVAVSHEPTAPSSAALTLQVLEKGDSFLIKDELAAIKTSKVVRSANTREADRKSSKEFVTRKVGKGMRVWRVK